MPKEKSKPTSEFIFVAEKLPETRRGHLENQVYNQIISTALKSPKGTYRVELPDTSKNTLLYSLRRRIKRQNLTTLKLHCIEKKVYVEKLE